MYKGVRDRLDEHDEFIVTPFEVIESILECGKCKSKKTSVQYEIGNYFTSNKVSQQSLTNNYTVTLL